VGIISLRNGSSDANLDIQSDDFEFEQVLWKKPCLLLGNSLPVTGAIAKCSPSSKLNTMVTKFLPRDSHALAYAFDLVPYNFHGKWSLLIPLVGRSLLLPMPISS